MEDKENKKKSNSKLSNKKSATTYKKKKVNTANTTTTNKKIKVNIEKNDNKKKVNSTKNKKENKDKDISLIIMKIVFIALVILVCILLIVVINKKKENENKLFASMVFPVVEEKSTLPFSIDLTEVDEDDEYVFKVTNYRGDEVIDKDINYKITITNDTSAKIKLYRGKNNVDLIKDQKSTVLIDLKLYKNEKEDIYFRVTFDNLDNVKKDDFINILIESE